MKPSFLLHSVLGFKGSGPGLVISALFLIGCAKNDPAPVTTVVFSYISAAGDMTTKYSYSGTNVTRSDQYTRQWWSKPIQVNPGDSVSISSVSTDKLAKITVMIVVNGKEQFASIGTGSAKVKGKIQ